MQERDFEHGQRPVDMKAVYPVEMIVVHSPEGILRPARYRITEDGRQTVVGIAKILSRSQEKNACCHELVFGCQGMINNRMRSFELRYRVQECRWFLLLP